MYRFLSRSVATPFDSGGVERGRDAGFERRRSREFLFWDAMGNAAGDAVKSYADYQRERQLWSEKIAAAKAELARCGGCASAQAQLNRWQGVENQFQETAGSVFQSVGMPPIVAKALGITLPLAPTRSPEERTKECGIVKRQWVDQRSPVCQTKVDEYLACLRTFERKTGVCTADAAKVPGGECWEQSKFYQPCFNEDYEAVERERKAQEARAAGAIIPDHTRYATSATVVYGHVPDDFMPRLPPADVVRATLSKEYTRGEEVTQEIKFLMQKERVGGLRQISIKYFNWPDVAPQSTCFEADSPTDEIGLRVCEDLTEMTWRYHPPLLTCYYNGQARQLTADAMYWYGVRPEGADATNLLRRLQNHPLLQIGEPRTDCPATIEEANAIAAQFRSALANLAVPQVSATVALPRSEWEKQRQADSEARVEAELTRKLASFPIEGSFAATTHYLNGREDYSKCTIKKIGEQKLQFTCKERQHTYEATEAITGSSIVVRWSPKLELTYTVISSSPPQLMGQLAHNNYRHFLMRTGDLGVDALADQSAPDADSSIRAGPSLSAAIVGLWRAGPSKSLKPAPSKSVITLR